MVVDNVYWLMMVGVVVGVLVQVCFCCDQFCGEQLIGFVLGSKQVWCGGVVQYFGNCVQQVVCDDWVMVWFDVYGCVFVYDVVDYGCQCCVVVMVGSVCKYC